MADWIRKVGTTTSHPIEAVLQDASGPVDLPIGTTATIRAKITGSLAPKINALATVVFAGAPPGHVDRGRVRYTPVAANLDTAGIYEVDYLVNITGVGIQVFPEDGYLTLLVLAGADIE